MSATSETPTSEGGAPGASPAVARCHIDGHWVDGAGDTAERRSPATNTVVTRMTCATPGDVDAAVAAARRARHDWANTAALRRAEILHRAAGLLRERKEEAARLISLEMGKTYAESLEDVEYGADDLDFSAEDAIRNAGQVAATNTTEPGTKRKRILTINVPVGVAALLSPWNFPIAIPCELLGPALACGNTVVWKPSEASPASGQLLAEVLVAAGLPAGVFNCLQGAGDVGARMVTHPGTDMVGFVGSTATGEHISRSAGVKKLLLELGGNGPLVVMDDADLDKAVEATVTGAFYCGGQVCTAAERVLVHDAVHDAYVEKLVARTARVRLGDPLDPATDMGPLAIASSLEKTRAHLDDAVGKGARIVAGGAHDGLYHEPTVIVGVTSDMDIAQEETFGPVVPIMRFADRDEAVRVANETKYGLTGAVFTESMSHAWFLAEGIECGTVHVNETTNHWELLAPFGGMKQSGVGRILGDQSVAAFTNPKQITFELGDR
ncbi:MAG TPA: aldehyde dehydrogenase family protein [Baekduia sp.]|uniref:aldehyde dehydrogenase family protein n=1 Tax=Baekduia sp. TaxID=2600305 RepID=UPI002D794085|nr:aldehyde dehydrogenase family protein [Baekduia sp.]HET6509116.1 aldehyde dehydrogenase family protein [Baekduia sp.]